MDNWIPLGVKEPSNVEALHGVASTLDFIGLRGKGIVDLIKDFYFCANIFQLLFEFLDPGCYWLGVLAFL